MTDDMNQGFARLDAALRLMDTEINARLDQALALLDAMHRDAEAFERRFRDLTGS